MSNHHIDSALEVMNEILESPDWDKILGPVKLFDSGKCIRCSVRVDETRISCDRCFAWMACETDDDPMNDVAPDLEAEDYTWSFDLEDVEFSSAVLPTWA